MRRFFLVLLAAVACSDGTGPSREDVLHDVIVFRRITGPNTGQLYMVHPDATGLQPILTGTGKVQARPAVSRDGRIVAYSDTTCRVWLQEYPEGSPVEAFRVEDCPGLARWSRTGRLGATRDSNLIVMDTVGGTPLTVLDDQYLNFWFDWHPVENRMTFSSKRQDDWAVYELDLNTGLVSPLIDTPGGESSPRWDPAGRRLTYGIEASIVDTITPGLWMFDVDRGMDTLLIADAGCPCPWSPDGRYVAFLTSDAAPQPGLARLEVATGVQQVIVPREAGTFDAQPDWAW